MNKESEVMPANTSIVSNGNFAFDSLEAIRNRLLDLTGRNRLLNFKHNSRGVVRIIDEMPDQLATLILDGRSMTFIPVDEPTKDELIDLGYLTTNDEGEEVRVKPAPSSRDWASIKGFNISYELPSSLTSDESKHNDTDIQTIIYPRELEAQLRGIRTKANTAIEETGANILYIAFGFLEWFEDENSDIAKLAPLYLIPIKIERAALDKELGIYKYTIQYTGEDIVSNLSLREKLRNDFHVGLPEIEENVLPEAYLNLVSSNVLKNKPHWKLRRFASLAMFDFGKLLMYLDLDPTRWPNSSKNIQNHPILQKFFASNGQDSEQVNYGFSNEYEIDKLDEIHDVYPLIDDADSSQHSALIDAIKGKNLVIEGPPGSGKSQTITNLIAAAISQGKKVLFVAEKMAALEVVKTRLEKAGLGDFCLELHSNKTQKKQVYENIRSRIEHQRNFRYPDTIDLDIRMYEEKKDHLTEYANLINSTWKETGRTVHQIFTKATRFREDYKDLKLEDVKPEHINGETFDELSSRRIIDDLKRYSLAFEEIRRQVGLESTIDSHPWFGVYDESIQMFDSDEVSCLLKIWQDELKALSNKIEDFNASYELEIEKIEEIRELINDFENIPKLDGKESFEAVSRLSDSDLINMKSILSEFNELTKVYDSLSQSIDKSLLNSPQGLSEAQSSIENAKQLFKHDSTPVSKLHIHVEEIANLQKLFNSIEGDLCIYREQIPDIKEFIPSSWQGHEVLKNISECLLCLNSLSINRRHDIFDQEELDYILPDLELILQELKILREKLKVYFNLDSLPSDSQLLEVSSILQNAGMFKWFSGTWREARRRLLSLSTSLKPDLKVISDDLIDLARYKKLCDELEDISQCQALLQHEYKGIDTEIERLVDLRSWYKLVRERFGHGFSKHSQIASTIFSMNNDTFKSLKHLAENKTNAELESLVPLRNNLRQQINSNLLEDSDVSLSYIDFEKLHSSLLSTVKALQPIIVKDLNISELEYAIRVNTSFQKRAELISNSELVLRIFGADIKLEARDGNYQSTDVVNSTITLYENIKNLTNIQFKELLLKRIQPVMLDSLRKEQGLIIEAKQSSDDSMLAFTKKVALDLSAWGLSCDDKFKLLIERNEIALRQPKWLITWVDFIRIRNSLVNQGLEQLLRQTETRALELEDIEEIFVYSVFDILSREIINECPQLAHFSGADHNAIRHQFKEYDEKLKKLQREKIAFSVAEQGMKSLISGISSGRISSYSEMGLINHEINKKTRHIPLRQAIKRASKSLLALKPCFMMGPNSVAQYLEPGQIEFDLVIMDEASQIKPEDSLGTVARGKQLVVVGDPKQLPPTSFFDKAVESENEDITAVEQSESILDVSLPMFNARRLRWHYRSRHESLIAFSNQEFYDNNLVIFPSPSSKTDEFGIKFTHVKSGFFVNQKNIEEAQVVAESVRSHILTSPSESLGVVAMSAQQREQIERCVEELSKDDTQFRDALNAQESSGEPLFIKNLENVQGDERDVIYISCTYGPQQAGAASMPQRFGPINQDNGGRRLNVLFTRSKKRMHVFSSMTEGHILVNSNSKAGVRALKKFLGFAQNSTLQQPNITGREPDSDFEIAVMNALNQEGFECEPQVGEAGYYIDLAVRDPGQPGRFLMGIECDGATYHSSKSARDRDRLRQSVLEGLGWRIARIWSTDWFKNPQAQLKPIIEELHILKTEDSKLDYVDRDTLVANDAVQHENEVIESISSYNVSELTLQEKLQQFDKDVISLSGNDTDPTRKLLRPAMIDALCEYKPISKNEFLEVIPRYLRDGTDTAQGIFLERVLGIIAEDEEELESAN